MAILPIPPVKAIASAKDAIRQQIVFALNDLDVNQNQEVMVFFKVGKAKEFVLLKVEGENPALVKKVETELRKESIRVPMILEGAYYLKVRFLKDGIENEIVKPEELLRDQLAEKLSSIETSESGKVSVTFLWMTILFALRK
ncbi:MAG: hypothetical protein HC830_13900 [Bacteroidetes bacterium]|nr:hypothetical protein [Bacteroidota bacterium]